MPSLVFVPTVSPLSFLSLLERFFHLARSFFDSEVQFALNFVPADSRGPLEKFEDLFHKFQNCLWDLRIDASQLNDTLGKMPTSSATLLAGAAGFR
jgi:hypothetical protein